MLKEIDAVILCGGLGTRLKPVVSDRPKVLAKIGDIAFLDVLLSSLAKYELKNIILCVGYLKEQIKAHFNSNYNIKFSEEDEPLGTGGALKKAKPLIKSNPFIVLNGDSICNINFREFFNFHINKKGILSMVLARSKAVQDFGNVMLDSSQRITSFKEKVVCRNECLINAGIYIMKKEIFSYMPDEKHFSLEYDLFSGLIEGDCYGFITESELIDIGTPERYEKAINLIGEFK
ncbi:nucleotidyltransferase family protein [Patescibacteria group bacterium]|nr:nucleotidyltransferase family protein [Patescibacteria group bacterium]MBU0846464.1 nucleotidyltransferase family protein [Patescibacteria group bacterium]